MIKYLIKNPHKWSELELFRFLHSFGTDFDKQIFEFLNAPTNEKGFILTLSPLNREIYSKMPLDYFNDDQELLNNCYLLAEKSMLDNTIKLVQRVQSEISDKDIFETLEELKNGSEIILENAVIQEKDYFEIWASELEKKINGEIEILESEILTSNVPLMGSELTILAARPSMGKTALAISVILEMVEKGKKCFFISSEMPVPRIIDRMVSYKTGISTRKISQGRLTDSEIVQIMDAASEIQNNENLILEYSESMRKIKRLISNTDSDLVVVDYLQLIRPENPKLDRRLQVAEMSRDFKRISVQKNIPIMVLAQINRESTKSNDKRPTLTSLAESAAIEQDADNVVFIHRPTYYFSDEIKSELSDDDLSETELIIEKQRDGKRGIEKCKFVNGRFFPTDSGDDDFNDSGDDDFDFNDFEYGDPF